MIIISNNVQFKQYILKYYLYKWLHQLDGILSS